jgi:O-antigen/teichoic acid export membrane protein
MRYTIGSVLVLAAGFVSFPIMARLLDYTQYGLLGVFDSALMILAAVFKFGAQHSILRFYPHRGGEGALARYGANFILLPFLGSCVLWLLAIAAFAMLPRLETYAHDATGWVALFTLLPVIWISSVSGVLMAEERSELNVLVNVGQRWLGVLAIVGIVYFISRTALGVYIARLGVALVVAAMLAVWLWRRGIPMRWRDRDRASLWAGMRYGVPLMANEISSIALVSVDRLMLGGLTGSLAAVGIYTVGSSLALQVSTMLHSALNVAYTQVSIRQFETDGVAAVLRTKQRILHFLVYTVVAMLVGLVTVGDDAFLLLSGHSKAQSVPIFVLLCINFVLNGLLHLCTSGLQLYKRSATIFMLTLGGVLLNIALNLILIPRFGVMGAVYATFASYLGLNLARLFVAPRALLAEPGLRPTLTACGLGLVVWLAVHYSGLFGVTSHFGRLLMVAVLMLVLYVLPALALDRFMREMLAGHWNKLRGRFA